MTFICLHVRNLWILIMISTSIKTSKFTIDAKIYSFPEFHDDFGLGLAVIPYTFMHAMYR